MVEIFERVDTFAPMGGIVGIDIEASEQHENRRYPLQAKKGVPEKIEFRNPLVLLWCRRGESNSHRRTSTRP